MPRYTSADRVPAGLPLGGLGTGAVRILPDGTLDAITYQNNWSNPTAAKVGNHFAIFARPASRCAEGGGPPAAMLLQTVRVRDIPCVRSIEFEGAFPVARLRYLDDSLPVDVSLAAFSPVVLGDARLSGTPAALFRFTLRNHNGYPVDVAIMATHLNRVSRWSVGRYNRLVKAGEIVGVNFNCSNPLLHDHLAGDVTLAAVKGRARISYHCQCNPKHDDLWRLDLANETIEPWPAFSTSGTLPDSDTGEELLGERHEAMGAVAQALTLQPGQSEDLTFVLAWHMPRHHVGHSYAKWFKDSVEVAGFVAPRVREIEDRVQAWQRCVLDAPVPDFLKDCLINNLYPFASATWWGRDGSFAFHEAPIICPLMDTLDVRYYGSIPLALFYPELEKTSMEQFARAQRADGYVPHDLGRDRLDQPSDGTTSPPRWKDLCPKFALLAYRDYLWTADQSWLARLYPYVRRAMQWEMKADRDGDGLPENEGPDQTYDNWDVRGASAYTSSIFLAACRAAERMARLCGDEEFAAECGSYHARGSQSFQDSLWNGRFFEACAGTTGTGAASGTCTAGQLNGQWCSHLVGLGYILPQEQVREAVRAMLELNGRNSRYGATNSVHPDGSRDLSNIHSLSVWPGESYALASLAIYEGYAEEGLVLAEKTWWNVASRAKNPWNQPDVIDPDTGEFGFGDSYMRNMVAWAVFLALAEQRPGVADAVRALLALARQGPGVGE